MGKNKYYSQIRQDRYVDFLFSRKENGVFVDIGANDGVTLSNTYFLEKERHWTGVCIEPIPSSFEKLKANRNCILENCCITDEDGDVIFREITGHAEMLSGILDFFDDNHLNRIEKYIKEFGGTYRDIQIKAKNINNILEDNGLYNIDYCSIDTEGAEELIVKSIDFDKFNIKTFTIENNNNDNALREYLKQKGYKRVLLVWDDVYFKEGISRIYRTMFLIYLFRFTNWVNNIPWIIKQILRKRGLLKN